MAISESGGTHLGTHGMSRPDMESDACAVGLVAATDGKARRRVVQSAIDAPGTSADPDARA